MRDFEPLAPACMKCEQVTGKSTCFPGPCVFFHERNTPETKAHNVATLDRIRRGSRDPVFAQVGTRRMAETGTGSGRSPSDAVGEADAPNPLPGGNS